MKLTALGLGIWIILSSSVAAAEKNSRILSERAICQSLYRTISGPVQSKVKAGSWEKVNNFLMLLHSSPNRIFLRKNKGQIKPFWDVSRIVGSVAGATQSMIPITNPDELRFLPYTLDGSHILLLLDGNSAILEPFKVKRLKNVAATKSIDFSIAYFDREPDPVMNQLSLDTNGKVIRFNQETRQTCMNMQNLSR